MELVVLNICLEGFVNPSQWSWFCVMSAREQRTQCCAGIRVTHLYILTYPGRVKNSRNCFWYRISVFMFLENFKNLPFWQPVFFAGCFTKKLLVLWCRWNTHNQRVLSFLFFSFRTGNLDSENCKAPKPLVI